MRHALALCAALIPTGALAEAFRRPIPQPQTAQAEISYLAAALLLLAALVAVQWLVSRR
jgi:hypothetical protein